MNKKDEKESLFCSFCGKSQKEVKKLIAGPTVFVCDECVELCMDIIKEDTKNNKIKLKKDTPKPSEIKKTKNRLNEIYSKHTGKKIDEIQKIMERDRYFSPEEAIKFGLIDKIVNSRKP
jgi:hypothetical protein